VHQFAYIILYVCVASPINTAVMRLNAILLNVSLTSCESLLLCVFATIGFLIFLPFADPCIIAERMVTR